MIKKSENIRFKKIEKEKKVIQKIVNSYIKEAAKNGKKYVCINFEVLHFGQYFKILTAERACEIAFQYLTLKGFKTKGTVLYPETELKILLTNNEEESEW
jgi:uncharacterized protein YpmS